MSITKSSPTTSLVLPRSEETSFWMLGHGSNGTVVIDVRSFDEMLTDIEREGEDPDSTPRITFVSYQLMHKVLAPNRMDILHTMTGAGPLSIREIARRVGRDFKGVHTDVAALLKSRLVHKTKDELILFPFDTIRFQFEIGGPHQSAA